MSDLPAQLAQWSVNVVHSFGYVGVFVLVALSNLLLPIPSQLVLSLSGFLVSQGRFSFPLVLLISTAASLASALILYAPGYFVGLGWALGARWTIVAQYAQPLRYLGLAIVVAGIFWFLWRRRRAHR